MDVMQQWRATVDVPSDVALFVDVPYGAADGEPLLLDVAMPEPGPVTPAPAIVWIHGGGWQAGDKHLDLDQSIGLPLIRQGFVRLSINYRLSDQARFPAQIHDAKAAIRWLRSHAA